MLDLMISGLLRQAKQIDGMGQRAAETVKLNVIFITPNANIKSLGVDGYSELADYVNNRSNDIDISVRLQPSIYIKELLPYKDNLKAQLIITDGKEQVVTEYIAVPLLDSDPRMEGNQSYHANVEGLSQATFNSYKFQFLEPIYARLRTIELSHISLMGNMENTISLVIDTETKKAISDTQYKYDGLVMDSPVDNDTTYKAIVVKEGVKVINFPVVLQDDERYGVYEKGLGFYFKQRRWWCYKLYDLTKYDKHPKPIEIIRFPEDKAPTLEYTFFISDSNLTILSTGKAEQNDGTDILRQNAGVGARLVQPTLISGETGLHYNAGRAIKTRADSMAEYATTTRGSGDDYIPLNSKPSSNICKYASATAIADGSLMYIPWHCGDPGYLEPGAPIRYTYMGSNNRMEVRKGILLGYRMDTKVIDPISLLMKRSITLFIFMSKSTESNNNV